MGGRNIVYQDCQLMAPNQQFADVTLINTQLNLADIRLERCVLKHCVLHFSGKSCTLLNSEFYNCTWLLTGELLAGIQGLTTMFGVEGCIDMVRNAMTPPDKRSFN